MQRLTARSRTGISKPLSLSLQVPRQEHLNWRHRIYWRGVRQPESYNCAAELFTNPCLRRWNDFVGNWTPKHIRYAYYTPPNPVLLAKATRTWDLEEEFEGTSGKYRLLNRVYTNVVEGWLIVLSGKVFANRDFFLEYRERV